MTHRGPFQPLPFCDSVRGGAGKGTEDCLRAPGRASGSARRLRGRNSISVPGYGARQECKSWSFQGTALNYGRSWAAREPAKAVPMIQERARGSAARQSAVSCPGGHHAAFWREFKVLYSSMVEMALSSPLFLLSLVEFAICQSWRGDFWLARLGRGERWGPTRAVWERHVIFCLRSLFD